MNVLALSSVRRPEPRPVPTRPLVPLDIRHLVIDDCLHPLQANGVHQVARLLAREQLHAGDDAKIVLFRSPQSDHGDETCDVPMDVLPLAGTKVLGKLVRLAPEIMKTLTAGTGRNTVFHIHGGRQPLLLSLSRELSRRGIPYGMTIHGRYSHLFDRQARPVKRLPVLYLKTLERRVLEAARFVHAVSPSEADIIRVVAPRARIELIPNAAYSSAIEGAPPLPTRNSPSLRFPMFGFCGRYAIEHKGIDLLIEGFAQYREAGGKGHLVLIGTGPAREQINAMAATFNLGDAIDIGGPRFGQEKTDALNTWDFFVQSSRFDGVPIGAIEAALLGIPLIVTAETGLQDYLNAFDAGVAIPTLTAEGVATALHKAEQISTQSWTVMSRQAHAMARSIGDWTVIATQLRRLYDRS